MRLGADDPVGALLELAANPANCLWFLKWLEELKFRREEEGHFERKFAIRRVKRVEFPGFLPGGHDQPCFQRRAQRGEDVDQCFVIVQNRGREFHFDDESGNLRAPLVARVGEFKCSTALSNGFREL